jgi:ubiquinol-cytochrome c reductase cytochrome b subunit
MVARKEPSLYTEPIEWIKQRLERTTWQEWNVAGYKLTIPERFVSPLSFLGMLTTVAFLFLGITGALLMLYYQPLFLLNNNGTVAQSPFTSVQRINFGISFGDWLRYLHYTLSNAMVLLAFLHLFYQYFAGRYKLRYEVLWVTGMIFGIITILEAFTGYDLIASVRARLAINIGEALMQSSPVVGPLLFQLLRGSGIADLFIRFYALHVFIVPLIMILLMTLHLPRALILDIPVISMTLGIIFIVAGLFPVELGVPFSPVGEVGITTPEWYLNSLYAFLRTGIDRFFAGVLLPTIILIIFIVIPFLDIGRKLTLRDRPFWVALGVMAASEFMLTTVWGFRAGNIISPLSDLNLNSLPIGVAVFFGAQAIIAIASYLTVYAIAKRQKARMALPRAASTGKKPQPYALSRIEYQMILFGVIGFQILFDVFAFLAYAKGFSNIALAEIGASLAGFGIVYHMFRVGRTIEAKLAAVIIK